MRLAIRRLRGALIGVVLSGCAHAQRVALGYNVSSERSDYSPTARLAVAVPVALDSPDGTIQILIDSAVVSAPGQTASDTIPVVRDLVVTALLVVASDGGKHRDQPAAPWRVLAVGDSAPLVDALDLGEERHVSADTSFHRSSCRA